MKLEGEKIYLQEGLVEENYPYLLEWFHDVEVVGYAIWAKKGLALKDVDDLKEFITRLENGIVFGIYDKADKFIGYTALADLRDKEECEFVIFIMDKNYWGKGIGLEITNLMVDYAFNDLQIKKVILTTSEFHKYAIKLYEKAGFKKTNLIPNDRTIFHNGEWVLSGTVEMEIENKRGQ